MRAALVFALVAIALGGCKKPAPQPIRETAVTSPTPSAPTPQPEASRAAPETPGLAPSGATRAEHEERVLAILTGARGVSGLPLVATEPGETLDPSLRDVLAPRANFNPRLKMTAVQVSDGLPKEVVARIARQQYGRLRACYERGLAINPNLQGDVALDFVIEPDGKVKSASNAGSTIPDAAVIECMRGAFESTAFAQPEAGARVRVHYVLSCQPKS